jgi:alkanesulfonate monooxygenase SsuD/methylene tetrahydromethanopterin reductase-like flavin-dependent oxidoreductase (luciferase family)
MDVLGIESASFGTQIAVPGTLHRRWGGPNLIGTPQQVAEQFAEFSAAGLGGAIFGSWTTKELTEFGAEVMPILRKEGLRH